MTIDKIETLKWQMGQLAYDLYQEQEVIGGWDKDGPILVTRKQQKEAQKTVMEHVNKLIDEVAEAKKHRMWERAAEWEELKKTVDPKVIEQISKKIEEAENRMITEATKAVYGVE